MTSSQPERLSTGLPYWARAGIWGASFPRSVPTGLWLASTIHAPTCLSRSFWISVQGVEIQPVAELYEAVCDRVCVDELLPSQLIFSDELGARRGAIALQAIYSNVVALVGLAVLAVISLPVAFAIKLSSRGPVMQEHSRWGVNLVPFTLYRFRCRRADGSVTGIGKWLRRLISTDCRSC